MNPSLKKAISAVAVSLFALPLIHAGSPDTDVYPKPQIYKISGGASLEAGKLSAASISKNPELKRVLPRTFKAKKIKAAGAVPIVVEKNAAKVAKLAHAEGITLKEACVRLGLVDEEKYDEIVDPEKMV